tara:strand:- start:2874 stop:3059 length:186 start_codon:yes stop_codon:yes gene_type:complete
MEDTIKNPKELPNKEILKEMASLKEEFEKTKSLLINLSHHLDNVEGSYNKLNEEIKKRTNE